MMLSDHFGLDEFTKSQTAIRNGIKNTPSAVQIEAMKALCINVLEPIRAHFGRPVRLSSGFRSRALNQAVGGSQTSQHSKGEAADFEIPGVSNKRVAQWIKDNLKYDQLILEGYDGVDPNSGWIHVSYSARRRGQYGIWNRRQGYRWGTLG